MITTFFRRARQFADDPALRRWVARRVLGRAPRPAPFVPHRPPYLGAGAPAAETPAPPGTFAVLPGGNPQVPIRLPLAGLGLDLVPGDEKGLFRRTFDDIETLLALHRFAWLPLVREAGKGAWAQALWDEWRRDFAAPDGGWAWHPYTAAERAVNVLDLAGAEGLPEPAAETVRLLQRHAGAIMARLEYFGEHDTSNHLSNNGRALYRLGLALGMAGTAEAGLAILENEARRLFMASGILREGSSHYHLLVARNYADAWLAARRLGRAETPRLRDIAAGALAVVPRLVLPGGMPLIGDVSPDCPPDHLLGLAGAGTGWVGGLSDDDRKAVMDLVAATAAAGDDALAADGWLHFAHGPWSGLWHAAPLGWPPMPGHGHQDTGAFEAHFHATPVFVDPGRGAYGETGAAARYRSAGVHNTILIGGHDPYPPNKPYYDDAFRLDIGGPPPALSATGNEVTVRHSGFRRLGGPGAVRRRWRFTDNGMTLLDEIDGRGRQRVTRILVTPLAVEESPRGLALTDGDVTFILHGTDGEIRTEPITLWHGYGAGRPGRLIRIDADVALPWTGEIRLELS